VGANAHVRWLLPGSAFCKRVGKRGAAKGTHGAADLLKAAGLLPSSVAFGKWRFPLRPSPLPSQLCACGGGVCVRMRMGTAGNPVWPARFHREAAYGGLHLGLPGCACLRVAEEWLCKMWAHGRLLLPCRGPLCLHGGAWPADVGTRLFFGAPASTPAKKRRSREAPALLVLDEEDGTAPSKKVHHGGTGKKAAPRALGQARVEGLVVLVVVLRCLSGWWWAAHRKESCCTDGAASSAGCRKRGCTEPLWPSPSSASCRKRGCTEPLWPSRAVATPAPADHG
jgi:hypothetical protein